LGDRVRIATEPLFSFQAQGLLAVNGSLANPSPQGEIVLTQGRVSLFTTTFSLSRRSRNVAIFKPENGLNPDLKLQLVAAATEVNRRQSLFSTTSSAEVIDLNPNDLGSIQTIRVRADVDGPADRLLDSIRLSSSPGRSQAEIVSLIGGGFVDTLGRGGDSTLALANLAGSAVLGNIQSLINNSIGGPVELRLFPAVVDAQDRRNQAASGDDKRNSVFALGGEVGVNITNNFSFSALRLLTVDVPTQYNLRYQLSDSLTLRATSDFRGENRAVLDYESRF
jgi:translocation and assembly module TamB